MAARILFPGAIAVLAVLYGWIALSFPSMALEEGFGPGLFPAFVAAIVGALAVAEVIIQSMRAYHLNRNVPPGDFPKTSVTQRELVATATVIVLVVATVFAIRQIGFIPAASALVFLLSLAMGMRPVWLSAIASVAIALTAHVIFSKLFGLVMAF